MELSGQLHAPVTPPPDPTNKRPGGPPEPVWALLTQWRRVLLERLIGLQLVKKFLAFHGTRRFIAAFTVPATCPYPEPARSSPYTYIPLPEDPS